MTTQIVGEDPHGNKTLIAQLVNAACNQGSGLEMHVNVRGGKPANENLVFGPGSLEKVELGADFTLTLTFTGARYWLQDKGKNHLLVRQLLAGEPVHFPPEMSFSGTALVQQAELAPAK